MEQSFKLFQLLLEAHIRKDYGPLLADKRKGFFKIQVPFLHQECYNTSRRAGDARIAMNEDGASARHRILDESYGCRKVP